MGISWTVLLQDLLKASFEIAAWTIRPTFSRSRNDSSVAPVTTNSIEGVTAIKPGYTHNNRRKQNLRACFIQ